MSGAGKIMRGSFDGSDGAADGISGGDSSTSLVESRSLETFMRWSTIAAATGGCWISQAVGGMFR